MHVLRLLFFSFLLCFSAQYADEHSIPAGEVQVEEEGEADVGALEEEFRASLLQVVLKGQILEENHTPENEKAYQSIIDLVIARILPEMTLEEPLDLIEFYRVMSAFETERMKYFLPLLQDLLRKIQSKIALGESEESEEAMLRKNAELIRTIYRTMESRLSELEEGSDDPNPSEGNEGAEPADELDADSLESTDSDSKPQLSRIEKLIDQNVKAIVSMQAEISRLRQDMKSGLNRSSSGRSAQIQERMESVLKSMERRQDKTLELLQNLVDQSTVSQASLAEEDSLEDGNEDFVEEEDRYSSVQDSSAPIPPLAFEFMVYGSDLKGLKRLIRAGSPSAEGTTQFDPRVYEVLQNNGGKWIRLLKEWNYKGIPTTLTAELGQAGIRVHLGKDQDALDQFKSKYQDAVDTYLDDGGRPCLLQAAKRARLDMNPSSLNCN